MLNEYLSVLELESSLRDFLEDYNFLFTQIEPERTRSIFGDKPLLAKLHHSINLDKYNQRSFRKSLLMGAPEDQVLEFARQSIRRDIKHAEVRSEEFRTRLATFNWGNNQDTKNFVRIFGYPEYLIPTDNSDVVPVRNILSPKDPFNQLKDYQAQVVFEAMDVIRNPNSRFLVHMPTGSGKTRVAMEVVSHFLNDGEGRQVIWLADRKELCEQAMDAFVRVWAHLGRRPLRAYRMWGDAPIPSVLKGTVFAVAMYQSLRQIRDVPKADLVVPDEAHIATAPTYSEIIEGMRDRRVRQTRIMGLTATPGRGSGIIDENEDLSSFFNNNIVGIKGDGGTIESLQRKGILARCEREVINPNISYMLTEDEWKKLAKDYEREFPSGLLEKIANDNARTLQIILKLRDMSDRYKRVMVFCGSVRQSKLMSSLMGACGHQSAYVDGGSPPGYRKDVVSKFRHGDLKFLFNYGVFTAGFDVPKIDAVVIARPTTSVVLYGQMIGRGMRGPVMGGTAAFTLVDVVDNIITQQGGLDNVHEYFSEYWE